MFALPYPAAYPYYTLLYLIYRYLFSSTVSFHHILLLPNLTWPYLTFASLTYPKLVSLHQNTTAPHYDYTTLTTILHYKLHCTLTPHHNTIQYDTKQYNTPARTGRQTNGRRDGKDNIQNSDKIKFVRT